METPHHRLVFLLDTDCNYSRSRKQVGNILWRKPEWLFRFVIDPDVESSKNREGKALRPSVIYRKVSSGTISERGSDAYARL